MNNYFILTLTDVFLFSFVLFLCLNDTRVYCTYTYRNTHSNNIFLISPFYNSMITYRI